MVVKEGLFAENIAPQVEPLPIIDPKGEHALKFCKIGINSKERFGVVRDLEIAVVVDLSVKNAYQLALAHRLRSFGIEDVEALVAQKDAICFVYPLSVGPTMAHGAQR